MENSTESKFLVIDVETANPDFSSICQIGISEFNNGKLINTWESLINPEDYFDSHNISIHGIKPNMIKDAPTLPEISHIIKGLVENQILFHHMPFDKIALNRAFIKYELDFLDTCWVDSAKLVRRTWKEFSTSGYGLKNISNYLGIKFNHHNALEDSIATGNVILKALEINNFKIGDCIERLRKPVTTYKNNSVSIKLEGSSEGPLSGENMVFTGSLFLTRAEAAKMAAEMGCNVSNSVTKKTTILIVGSQDNFKLNGYKKSSKHRKAEELLLEGVDLKIMSENDFRNLINN